MSVWNGGAPHDVAWEIRKIIGSINITTNIYIYIYIERERERERERLEVYYLIMHGYFCIWFIDFMIKDKNLLDYTYLLSPCEYRKND